MENHRLFNFFRAVIIVLSGCSLPFLFFITWSSAFQPQVVVLVEPPIAGNINLNRKTNIPPLTSERRSIEVTPTLLRQHVQSHGLLLEQCEVPMRNASGDGEINWLGCTFPTPKQSIDQCLRSKGIKRIVIIGDSQGKKFAMALRIILAHTMRIFCSTDSKVGLRKFVNETMTEAEEELLTTTFNTTCPSCHGFTATCRDISIEHIGLTSIDQATISLPPKEKSYMDFLLKVYLKQHPPDMLILYPPYNHMKREEFPSAKLRQQLPRVLKTMKISLSSAKSFVVLSGLSEHEAARKDNDIYYMHKFFGSLANDRIYDMTLTLGRILQKQKTLQDPRFSTFVNLNNATRNSGEFCVDGIHYFGVYALVMNALFDMLCSSWGF